MKNVPAKVTLRMGNSLLQVDANKPEDVFKAAASYAEVLCEPNCGLCGSDYRMGFRTAESYEFCYLQCLNDSCRARLDFGNLKEGGLFPKRKDEQGNWDYKHRGWKKYLRPTEESGGDSPAASSSKAPIKRSGPVRQEDIPF